MFLLIAQILLWVLLGLAIWFVLLRLIPKEYLTWLGGAILLTVIILAFFFPTDRSIATIWNIISLPLKPLGLTLLLLILGTKKKKESKLIWTAVAILLLSSIPWLADRYEYGLIRSNLAVQTNVCTTRTVSEADAIVLFSKGTTQPFLRYQPDVVAQQTSARIVEMARVYNELRTAGRVPQAIVVGRSTPFAWTVGQQTPNPNLEAATLARRFASLVGLPLGDIALLKGDTVREAATQVQDYLERRTDLGRRIVTISSSVDSPRVASAFTQDNFVVIPRAPALDTVVCDRENEAVELEQLIPNAESILQTSQVVDEFFTLIYYFLRGWIAPCADCWDK